MTVTLGFSPCPNDTFVFDAWVHGRIDAEGIRPDVRLEDVETLNALSRAGDLDITKASYGVIPHLADSYRLLRAGGALGRGCGPLLVGRRAWSRSEIAGAKVAIPGRYTTAHLLLRLWAEDQEIAAPGKAGPGQAQGPEIEERVYSAIMPAVARGEADLGLIIHESRFTYRDHGLHKVVDLGEWWEEATGAPIPLGGILVRRALGEEFAERANRVLRRSVEHAFRHPDDSDGYVRAHAREMDPEVMRNHIELYVNEHSVDLGDEGERAVAELFRRAAAAGLAPQTAPELVG